MTAHGWLSEQVKAMPLLSQPLRASGPSRPPLASQVRTGELTGPFSGQAHEGLQQSQYLRIAS